MKTFRHVSAESIEQATATLEERLGKARIIAGGTDLLGEMKDGICREDDYPQVIVDIKTIPGLDYIREEDGGLRVGALTKLADLAEDEVVKSKYPALAEAARRTASPHIREMGTVGGNLCQSNRCWYYWAKDNLFDCLRKGGKACYAIAGDSRYHSIFGAVRVETTACKKACPNSIDIPTYLGKIRSGAIDEAVDILLRRNPLGAITGRVCPHWCEQECARGEFDEAVAVREVERFLGDSALAGLERFYRAPAYETGKKVAVIGSGPAGLSAAYYLRQAGHQVTVMEKMPRPGGLLAHGIPPYRLPRDVVDRQVEAIKNTGVQLVLEKTVDKATFVELQGEYDAIFVAAGAGQETEVGIEGEECLLSGTNFLRAVYERPEELVGKTVGVIGGGNTAIDVARSLLRLGAQPVIFYRRTKDEMPALAEEIHKAEEEGVRFEFLTQPVRASEEPEGVALSCCRMELGELDASGRPRPVRIEGSEFSVRCDFVIKAIVERPDYSFLPDKFLDAHGRLRIDQATHTLGEGVFAGGDFATGPATVAAAINAGREAAAHINQFVLGLTGDQPASGGGEERPPVCVMGERFSSSCLQTLPRVEVPEVALAQKMKGLSVEETGTLTREAVEAEANRCFNCGCVAVNSSDLAPALVALGAVIRTSSRDIPAEEFFAVGVNSSTVLDAKEIVREVEVPEPPAGSKSAFLKFALRKSIDFPIVNCAAFVQSEDGVVQSARICLNSVFGAPWRVEAAEAALAGKRIDEAVAAQAAETAVGDAFALLNNKYKIQIAKTLIKRTILACA